ncbi:hypothetical protein FPQ18DRAFT_43333 [Pyronema domesticum]|nr:hypothetical protein FPQ18DRAFT_43333 [Pyronema domesticum]
MGNRANHFVCYAYELPVKPAKRTKDKGKEKAVSISESNTTATNAISTTTSNQSPSSDGDDEPTIVSYVQSIIKANIMTDFSTYDPMSAFQLIRSQPEDAVDEAFFSLSNAKVIAHKKHNRIAPGRNYELTDKFHLSLRTPMDEKLLAQGLKFDLGLRDLLSNKDAVELSPFVNDGSVACVMDLVANRRVILKKGNFKASPWGLVDGYETRSMQKHLVDFQLFLTPSDIFNEHPAFSTPLPPIPTGNLQVISPDTPTEISSTHPLEPIRIWIDMNHKIIKGMWLRVTTSVLSMVNLRPGITVREIGKILAPGLEEREVKDVVEWLKKRGAVRGEKMGTWPVEGFYRALEGM